MKELRINPLPGGLELVPYEDSYLVSLEDMERTGGLSQYQSHTRPKYLRETDRSARTNTLFYLMRYDGRFIGAIWLEDITKTDASLGIFIADPACRGLGLGARAITALTSAAFEGLRVNSINLNVRETNARALRCYDKCGFQITEVYPRSPFPDGSYQGAYRMTLHNGRP